MKLFMYFLFAYFLLQLDERVLRPKTLCRHCDLWRRFLVSLPQSWLAAIDARSRFVPLCSAPQCWIFQELRSALYCVEVC